jgi:hypothetical protein
MASDCIKKEYVRITNRNGDLRIDVLEPFKTEAKEQQKIETKDIVSIVSVSVLVVVAVTACCVVVNKRYSMK